MQGEGGTPLSELKAAVRKFRAREERVDLKEFRGGIDQLEGEFSLEAREAQRAGDHRVGGNISAASWISQICGLAVPPPNDRLCVGGRQEAPARTTGGRPSSAGPTR